MDTNETKQTEPLLFSNIKKYVDIDASEENQLKTFFSVNHVSKKTLLLTQGSLCQKFYFVEQGSLRAYHINKAGKESTIMFAVEDWWITDMSAFINKQPASISLETMDDCILYEIDSVSLEKILENMSKLERYFRILFQRAYVREQERVLGIISNTLEQRYLDFVENYPQIVKKVTQKQIASYLGVTPEFLSTIKNNIPS
ncbi:MAG: Crp/Fnr family transcriptional regulator [Bacteroidota bacterium]